MDTLTRTVRAVGALATAAALVLSLAGAPRAEAQAAQDPAPEAVAEPEPEPAPAPAPVAPPPTTLEVGEVTLAPAIESRARGEARIDPLLGPDQAFVTVRNRLSLGARWRFVGALVQLQDARDFGLVDPGAATGATTDLHQGWLELGDDEISLRLGRQEIDWGSQRFLGSLNWASAARAFDALRVRGRAGILSVDVVGAWVRMARTIPDARTPGATVDTEGDLLAGASATLSFAPLARLSAYVLYRHDGPTDVPATVTDPAQMGSYLDRHRDIAMPGLRLEGAEGQDLRYELELVMQVGRAGGRDHLAFGAVGELAQRFSGVPLAPGYAIGASYGTGAGGELSELDNFYPTNHARYGSADLIGLRNQIHGFARASIAPPGTNVEAWADLHLLALAEPGARWSDAPGRTIAQDPANAERFLGTEIDLEVRWRPERQIALWAGYSLFVPAPAAIALGRPDPTHWAYAMLGVTLP